MAFNINEMRAKLTGGGARSALFSVNVFNPVDGRADDDIRFMAKAASLPASNIPATEVHYFGRRLPLAATSRTYEPWTITVINDENFNVRAAFEEWSKRINTPAGNIRDMATSSDTEYQSVAEVTQYSKTGEVLRVYRFEGIWPTSIGAIETSWDNGNAIEEFQVTFEYVYWTVVGESS